MAELDEAIAGLEANIKNMEAGIDTPDAVWNARSNAGKNASDNLPTPPTPPGPPAPPPPPGPPTP